VAGILSVAVGVLFVLALDLPVSEIILLWAIVCVASGLWLIQIAWISAGRKP
jgi:hypothetical protein